VAKAGRKRKVGTRTRSGQLSRAGITPYDRGTERVQAIQALYGQDGCDAIGRAFRTGLLGEGSEAKALLDLARSLSNGYWIAYSTGSYQCAIGDRTHGSVIDLDHERIKRRETWLSECLSYVRQMGHSVDRPFRQLVIDVNPDSGPAWLDRLCYAKRTREAARADDEATLRAALDALEALVA
jgi:hypothetical protein